MHSEEEGRMSKRERLRLHFRSFQLDEAVLKVVYQRASISTICQETGLPYFELNARVLEYKKVNNLLKIKKPSKKSIKEISKARPLQVSLTESDDNVFSNYLKTLHSLGYSWNKTDILLCASVALNAKYNTKNNKKLLNPGNSWYQKLLETYPNLQNIINVKSTDLDLLKMSYKEQLAKAQATLQKFGCEISYFIFDEVCIDLDGTNSKLLYYIQRKSMTKMTKDCKMMFTITNVNGAFINTNFYQAPYGDCEKHTVKDIHQNLSFLFKTFVKEVLDKSISVPAICFYDAQLLYVDVFTIGSFWNNKLIFFPLPVNKEHKHHNENSPLSQMKKTFEEALSRENFVNSWSHLKNLCENLCSETMNRSTLDLYLKDCKLKDLL